MDSTSAWAGREWFVVRKAEVRLSEVRAVFPKQQKGGLEQGTGKGDPYTIHGESGMFTYVNC